MKLILALMLVLAATMVANGAEMPKKVVPASEILNKLQNGEHVLYNGIFIEGNLDLRSILKNSESFPINNGKFNIQSLIYITNSTFNGSVSFPRVTFVAPVDFSKSQFNEDVNFYGSSFNGYAYFDGSRFNETSSFKSCQFGDIVSFAGSYFNRDALIDFSQFERFADFTNCRFNGPSTFGGSQFMYDVNFTNCQFRELANFQRSQFYSAAIFYKSIFNKFVTFGVSQFGYVDFRRSQFNGGSYFGASNFNEQALFDESQFNGGSYFGGSNFNGKALFDGSRFYGASDFKSCQFGDIVDFRGSYFERDIRFDSSTFKNGVKFQGAKFNAAAYFIGSTFNGYVSDWESIKQSNFDETSYQSLIQSFKINGLYDVANDCYYVYRLNHMRNIIDYLSWLSCGFGVRWTYTIRFAFFIGALFALLYLIYGVHSLKGSVTFSAVALLSLPKELYGNEDEYKNLMDKHLPNIAYFGITNKLSFRVPFALERLIGWSLLILLINTLSRLMVHY